jgi:hypothetical protein
LHGETLALAIAGSENKALLVGLLISGRNARRLGPLDNVELRAAGVGEPSRFEGTESESDAVNVTYTTARFRTRVERDRRCMLIYPSPPKEDVLEPWSRRRRVKSSCRCSAAAERVDASDIEFLAFARRVTGARGLGTGIAPA